MASPGPQTGRPFPVKLSAPTTEVLLARPRLFELLDEAAARPIVWLGACAGAGKTTLAASWLEARGLPHLWYQVGDEDRDVATFFYFLGLGAEPFSEGRAPLPLLTLETRSGLAAFSRLFFIELFARLPRPSVLVFDNAERLPDDPPWQQAIADSLELVPPGVTVLFLGRDEPPPFLSRHRARRHVGTLAPEALRLDLGECGGLARVMLDGGRQAVESEPALPERLFRVSDGWAAGLVLLLEWVRRTRSLPDLVGDVASAGLFDYFASEVLARVDAETQRFLLETSVLPGVTAALAVELTGVTQAGQILARLHRQNFFTERHPTPEPTYTYHGAFREFLGARLRERWAPPALRDLEERAGRALLRAGRTEEALALLIRAGSFASAAALVRACAGELVGHGRTDTLGAWIDGLPAALVAAEPWLVYWRGIAHITSSPTEAHAALARALDRFAEQGDALGAFTAWADLVEIDQLLYTDLRALDERLVSFDELTRRFGEVPTPTLEARVATARFSALSCRRPGDPELDATAERAVSLTLRHGDASAKLRTAACVLFHYNYTGQDEAARALRTRLGGLERGDLSDVTRSFWSMGVSFHAVLTGRPDEALAIVDAALAHEMTASLCARQLLIAGGIAALAAGEPARAQGYLDRVQALVLAGKAQRQGLEYGLAYAHLVAEDTDLAVAHARRAVAEAAEMGHEILEHTAIVMLAGALVVAGAHEEAGRVIDDGLARCRRARSFRSEYLLLLVDADRRLTGGDPGAAPRLEEAWALGRAHGFVRSGLYLPPGLLARAARAALERGIEVEHVREVARAQRLASLEAGRVEPARLEVGRPWKIEVQTLGHFAIALDGGSALSWRKVPQRTLELLKALVAFGERDVPQDVVEQALWPDSDGDAAHRALEITLRRLRQLCLDPTTVVRSGGRLSLDERRVWTDLRALGDLCRRLATERVTPHDDDDGDDEAERLLALYRGDFLAGEELTWAGPVRDRLRALFARTVGTVARRLEERGAWERAADCYDRATAAAPTVESLYQGLMRCDAALGRQADAMAVYDRCLFALAGALSPETQLLKQRLGAV